LLAKGRSKTYKDLYFVKDSEAYTMDRMIVCGIITKVGIGFPRLNIEVTKLACKDLS
jgi:hypothetical protein